MPQLRPDAAKNKYIKNTNTKVKRTRDTALKELKALESRSTTGHYRLQISENLVGLNTEDSD